MGNNDKKAVTKALPQQANRYKLQTVVMMLMVYGLLNVVGYYAVHGSQDLVESVRSLSLISNGVDEPLTISNTSTKQKNLSGAQDVLDAQSMASQDVAEALAKVNQSQADVSDLLAVSQSTLSKVNSYKSSGLKATALNLPEPYYQSYDNGSYSLNQGSKLIELNETDYATVIASVIALDGLFGEFEADEAAYKEVYSEQEDRAAFNQSADILAKLAVNRDANSLTSVFIKPSVFAVSPAHDGYQAAFAQVKPRLNQPYDEQLRAVVNEKTVGAAVTDVKEGAFKRTQAARDLSELGAPHAVVNSHIANSHMANNASGFNKAEHLDVMTAILDEMSCATEALAAATKSFCSHFADFMGKVSHALYDAPVSLIFGAEAMADTLDELLEKEAVILVQGADRATYQEKAQEPSSAKSQAKDLSNLSSAGTLSTEVLTEHTAKSSNSSAAIPKASQDTAARIIKFRQDNWREYFNPELDENSLELNPNYVSWNTFEGGNYLPHSQEPWLEDGQYAALKAKYDALKAQDELAALIAYYELKAEDPWGMSLEEVEPLLNKFKYSYEQEIPYFSLIGINDLKVLVNKLLENNNATLEKAGLSRDSLEKLLSFVSRHISEVELLPFEIEAQVMIKKGLLPNKASKAKAATASLSKDADDVADAADIADVALNKPLEEAKKAALISQKDTNQAALLSPSSNTSASSDGLALKKPVFKLTTLLGQPYGVKEQRLLSDGRYIESVHLLKSNSDLYYAYELPVTLVFTGSQVNKILSLMTIDRMDSLNYAPFVKRFNGDDEVYAAEDKSQALAKSLVFKLIIKSDQAAYMLKAIALVRDLQSALKEGLNLEGQQVFLPEATHKQLAAIDLTKFYVSEEQKLARLNSEDKDLRAYVSSLKLSSAAQTTSDSRNPAQKSIEQESRGAGLNAAGIEACEGDAQTITANESKAFKAVPQAFVSKTTASQKALEGDAQALTFNEVKAYKAAPALVSKAAASHNTASQTALLSRDGSDSLPVNKALALNGTLDDEQIRGYYSLTDLDAMGFAYTSSNAPSNSLNKPSNKRSSPSYKSKQQSKAADKSGTNSNSSSKSTSTSNQDNQAPIWEQLSKQFKSLVEEGSMTYLYDGNGLNKGLQAGDVGAKESVRNDGLRAGNNGADKLDELASSDALDANTKADVYADAQAKVFAKEWDHANVYAAAKVSDNHASDAANPGSKPDSSAVDGRDDSTVEVKTKSDRRDLDDSIFTQSKKYFRFTAYEGDCDMPFIKTAAASDYSGSTKQTSTNKASYSKSSGNKSSGVKTSSSSSSSKASPRHQDDASGAAQGSNNSDDEGNATEQDEERDIYELDEDAEDHLIVTNQPLRDTLREFNDTLNTLSQTVNSLRHLFQVLGLMLYKAYTA